MKPDFAEIKRTTDLVAVVQRYGIELKREGKDWRGKCPFHDDQKRPNFIVSPAKGLWRCPACDLAGNVIQFVARMENLTEREAALKLLGTLPGVTTANKLSPPPQSEPPSVTIDEATRAKLLARVASFYAKTLHKDRAGLDYLKTRRLDDPTALETFQVGYCNGSMRNALPQEGEVVEQLKAIGVLNEKGNEVFYQRIVVPIHNAAGDVVSLYGRRLDDEEAKHLVIKGDRRGVFNGVTAKSHQSLVIVESIFDALSLWIAGFHNVIALRGKDGWSEEHAELIRINGVTEVYLALDNDGPGTIAADSLASRIAELSVTVHRIVWPDGVKDANDFFSSRVRAGRAEAEDFAALLKAANPQTEPVNANEQRLGKEAIELTVDGFAAVYGEGAGVRRYELCAVQKPSPSRLKATVKALAEANRFVIDTLDFYSIRSKRSFIAEAGRLFRETVDVIESDVNRLTLAAENYIVQKAAGAVTASAAVVSDAARAEGLKLGRSADLIGEVQRDLDRLGIIGERTNRLLLYLAMTSRKMDDPLAVQILSSSGAGKSHLQDAVLSLCPDEDLIKLTSLTDRALFYKGEDSLRHKAIAIAEVAGAEGARYALRSLISDKKLTIESTVKNPLTGRLETQVNTVYGPAAVFETTTNPDTDPETKSRYLLLSVDESPEQTRAILEAQRQRHTLEGMRRRHERTAVLARHYAFQRTLQKLAVVNPFEPLLSYGGEGGALPLRRDHPKYLSLIVVVTFLHQHQRAVKRDAVTGAEFIETTLEDIAIANELAVELFGQSLDELSSPSRELLRLIGDYVAAKAAEIDKPALEVEWTRRELRESIQWTEARLRLHLAELVRLEYIAALSGRFGSRFRYRLMVEPAQIAEDGRLIVSLKDVETLRREANLAGLNGNLARENPNLAGTSQPSTCEVLNGANPHEHKVNGSSRANLASVGGKRIYVLRPNGARKNVIEEVQL
jgi:DNA primase catalytic core